MEGQDALQVVDRLLMALLKWSMREWDSEHGSVNDSALAGKKPEVETAKRSLQSEVKHTLGFTSIVVLWDVDFFLTA